MIRYLAYFSEDKRVEHPRLGALTCSALHEHYRACLSKAPHEDKSLCGQGWDMTVRCFRAKDTQEFLAYLDQEIDERQRLFAHLRAVQSSIPKLLKQYNKYNFLDNLLEGSPRNTRLSSDYRAFLAREAKANREFT
jgi:hypothetical protein